MRLRRKARARHRAEPEEDLVIDLRERLAPYGRPVPNEGERDDVDEEDAPQAQPRSQRPLRSV